MFYLFNNICSRSSPWTGTPRIVTLRAAPNVLRVQSSNKVSVPLRRVFSGNSSKSQGFCASRGFIWVRMSAPVSSPDTVIASPKKWLVIGKRSDPTKDMLVLSQQPDCWDNHRPLYRSGCRFFWWWWSSPYSHFWAVPRFPGLRL